MDLLDRSSSDLGSAAGLSVHHHAEQRVGQGRFVVDQAEEGVKTRHDCGGDRTDCSRV